MIIGATQNAEDSFDGETLQSAVNTWTYYCVNVFCK